VIKYFAQRARRSQSLIVEVQRNYQRLFGGDYLPGPEEVGL
jgi:hypothetical protein